MIGIQSVRFSRSSFTLNESRVILQEMGFENLKPMTYSTWRTYHQMPVNRFKDNSFRTKMINKDIHLIIGDLLC